MARTKNRDCFVIMPFGTKSGTLDTADVGDTDESEKASEATDAALWKLLDGHGAGRTM